MCLPIKVRHPETVLAEGIHLGYEWTVTHNGIGYRCGYVRVPKGHPWHGSDGDGISVHGGVTFNEPDMPCDKGGPDDAYWLGFDCAHFGDLQDPELPAEYAMPSFKDGSTVKSTEYVKRECERLIEQAVECA